MQNISALFFGLSVFLFFGAYGVLAVTTSVNNPPSVIGQDPFELTVSITGAKAARNYLRVDVYKEGTNEYTGQTYNGADWYDGEDATKYFPIDITGSETNIATLSARLITIPSSWSMQDHFLLRIRRYTASGGYTSSEADASAIPISMNIPSPTPSPTPITEPTRALEPSITPLPTSTPLIENIYITEAMVAPETGQDEWIELYNDNNEAVMLTNWYIDDVENGGSNPKQFSTTINPHSYSVIELTSSLFNNDGDSVRLLNSTYQQVDNITYTLSEKGKSIGRNDTSTRTVCIELPSKNQVNTNCIPVVQITNFIPISPQVLGESINTYSTSTNEGTLDNVTQIPLNRPVVGDKIYEPTPLVPHTEFESVFTDQLLPKNNLTGLIKSLSTSSAGISLLNIAYILYRMRKWHLPVI